MTRRRCAIAVVLIGIFLFAAWLVLRLSAPAAKLSAGQCEFRLFVKRAEPEMPTYYRAFEYQVLVDGKSVVPRNQFAMSGAKFAELVFELIRSSDGQVVGLIEKSDPDVVLAVYAFDTRESYPAASMSETPSEAIARGKRLVARLNSERPFTLRELLKGRGTKL